jgi:hypothetical protein
MNEDQPIFGQINGRTWKPKAFPLRHKASFYGSTIPMSTNDVIKTETKNKRKCIHVDGRSSRYLATEQLFWYIYYALLMMKLEMMKWWIDQRWTMATSDVFVMKSIYDMDYGTGSMMIGVSVGANL